jgi:hypothetical protein
VSYADQLKSCKLQVAIPLEILPVVLSVPLSDSQDGRCSKKQDTNIATRQPAIKRES